MLKIFKVKKWILNTKFPLVIELFKWIFVDICRKIKYGEKIRLYGIHAYVGLYGGGKTMGMTYYLNKMRKKYGDKIYIFTNYFYKYQDGHIDDWKILLKNYDKPCIFAWDEIQNDFNSRKYQDFPIELMTLLTQNRKGHGKQILYTAQDFETVDKNFRRLTKTVNVCKTRFGRLTSIKTYDWEDYQHLINVNNVNIKMKIKSIKHCLFVQNDDIRNDYDSFQMLKAAQNKEYITRQERAVLL